MDAQTWKAVDEYFARAVVPVDDAAAQALAACAAAGLPEIQVSPLQGSWLRLLARLVGAREILEIGTLGGYSTIWLARALAPAGRLVTLELDPRHAEVARGNLARAGLGAVCEVLTGPAIEILPTLTGRGYGPFDLTFIDADKASTAVYFEWALRLTRPGGLIVVDNVVRDGAVLDANSADPGVIGLRAFVDRLAAMRESAATVIQTVGTKGYDGMALVRVGPG